MIISYPHQNTACKKSTFNCISSFTRFLTSKLFSFWILSFVALGLGIPTSAFATTVMVNWSAEVSPDMADVPSPGEGLLSGTLGIFDVNAVGDTFMLMPDDSLSIEASGFVGGFPNGSYSLNRGTSNPFLLEFLSFGDTAADFSVNIVDNNAGLLSAFPNPCVVDGIAQNCFVGLFDTSGTGVDIAFASLGIDGTTNDSSLGPIEYSFFVEATDVPESDSLLLLIMGIFALRFYRR